MPVYLDPVGGVAGDMFCAAILDAFPAFEAPLLAAFASAQLTDLVTVSRQLHDDKTLTGCKFSVVSVEVEAHVHRTYRDIRDLLSTRELDAEVRDHALAIFQLLAQAEAQVHGRAIDDVTFHEVGGWDSIADVVAAAWLIDRLGDQQWFCAPLPMGRGLVATAHGRLPVPAPATSLLLKDFPLYQDEFDGERITPTGAAILRHLQPKFTPVGHAAPLQSIGIGFGDREWPGLSNILRIMVFGESPRAAGTASETLSVCEFEIDDQPAEDLACGLTRLRALDGVVDVVQTSVFGKKGRIMFHIRLLVQPTARSTVEEACFRETTTLGVRWYDVQRTLLARDSLAVDGVRVKRAERPDGPSVKAEADDLANEPGHRGREARRRAAEAAALQPGAENESGT